MKNTIGNYESQQKESDDILNEAMDKLKKSENIQHCLRNKLDKLLVYYNENGTWSKELVKLIPVPD